MKVLSVNISRPEKVVFENNEFYTGYFKQPVQSILLCKPGVKDDTVIDTEHHGGEDKACYLFGFNHYEFWHKKYPEVSTGNGMFGENITLEYLDESQVRIGDKFQIGEAIVRITQPRQPCYKMGIKFNNQEIVKEFRMAHTPGIYVRVLQEGRVSKNDSFRLFKSCEDAPTVLETYRLIYDSNPDREKLLQLIRNEHVATRLKNYLLNKFKIK